MCFSRLGDRKTRITSILGTASNLGVLSLPVAFLLLYLLNSIQNSYTIALARRAGNRQIRDRRWGKHVTVELDKSSIIINLLCNSTF